MLQDIRIDRIKVGTRHRKEMGDLELLAENIRDNGLLQPIGVTAVSFELASLSQSPPRL